MRQNTTLSNFKVRHDVTSCILCFTGSNHKTCVRFATIPYNTHMSNGNLPEISNLLEVTSHLISKLDRVYVIEK